MTDIQITPKYKDVKPHGYYVYLHRRATDGSIFYVGKGKGKRAWSKDRSYNPYWTRVAEKHGVTVEVLKEGMNEVCAFTMEIILIGSIGVDNLSNITSGGEGASGYTHTDENKEKMKNNHKCFSLSNHPKWDNSVYSITNIDGDVLTGNGYELSILTGMTRGAIRSIINGNRFRRKGWCLSCNYGEPVGSDMNIGPRNHNFDGTIRSFTHASGLSFVGTSYDLTKNYDLDRSEVTKIVKGTKNTHKGWAMHVYRGRKR